MKNPIVIDNIDLIKKILEENKQGERDDDIQLYISLCYRLGYDLNGISAMQMIQNTDRFPRFDSVTRTRRLLQEEHRNLQGKKYAERQIYRQKKVKHEIREAHFDQRGQARMEL